MEALRSLARAEDKLLLVHFDASWCQPCHWMERHAFADEALATFVHEHFVPVVLRADEKQTAELCRRYEVELLPTLLVLDPEGNLIGKYEETRNAASLMMELRVLLRKREAPSRPYVFQNPRLMEPTARPQERDEYLAGAAEAPPAQATPPKPTLPLLVAETSRLQPVSHYSIQLGVFSDYANAVHFAGSLDGALPEPAIVFLSDTGNRARYRVVYGAFASEEEALRLQKRYQKELGKGLIRAVQKF